MLKLIAQRLALGLITLWAASVLIFFSTALTQPMASLTVTVYTYANSPYEDWHRQAWAGALVLVAIVFLCSLFARMATRRLERMRGR